MFQSQKWLLLSFISLLLFLGTFISFIIFDSFHSSVFYRGQDESAYNLTTITLPQTFDKKIYKNISELVGKRKVDMTFQAQANYLGIIAIPFNAHNRSINDNLIFRIKESSMKQWYAQNTYDTAQFQTDIPFPFGFPPITNSKYKFYTIEIESLRGKPGDALLLSNTPIFFTEYKFPKSVLTKQPFELIDFANAKLYESITHLTSSRFLMLLIAIFVPFLIYSVFPFILRLLYKIFTKRPTIWELLLIAFLVIILANLLLTSFSEITYLYPREYRDGAALDIANQFLLGSNPYTLKTSLPHTYLYGFIGPLLNTSISWILHTDPAITQHIITFIVMILLCILVGKEIWQGTKKIPLVLLSLVVVLLYTGVSFRIESLAILLTIFTLSIVNNNAKQKRDLNTQQLTLLALSVIILFYIKQYFLILFPVLIIYFIYNQSKKVLAYFIALFLIFGALSVLLVNKLFPIYFFNTFFNYIAVSGGPIWTDWMVQQSILFIELNWVIFLLFIIAFFIGFIKDMDIHFNITDKNKPFFIVSNTPLDNTYFIYCFVAILVLTFKLGNNGGAFLSYYIQLLPLPMTIFSICYLYSKFKKYRFHQAFFIGIVILFILENYIYLRVPAVANTQDRLAWDKAIEIVKNHDPQRAYLSSLFTIEAIRRGWPVSDTGHTEYFGLNALGNAMPPGSNDYLMPRLNEWKNELDYKISHKKFSLIVRPWGGQKQLNTDLLKQYYVLKYTVNVPTPDLGTIEFWVPK